MGWGRATKERTPEWSQEFDVPASESTTLIDVIKDVDLMISYLPHQVGRGRTTVTNGGSTFTIPTITLYFRRYLMFTFKDTFKVYVNVLGNSMVEYSLISNNGNVLKILFIIKRDRERWKLDVAAVYTGKSEWIVSKYLGEIAKTLAEAVIKEAGTRVTSVKATGASGETADLSKLSEVSKILMKSRLAEETSVMISQGNAVETILNLVEKYIGKYNNIYVSGISEGSSFRILISSGELKGIYVNVNGEESTDERSLNRLSGLFKVKIYTVLVPMKL
jgi:hypothetical protein